MTVHACARTTPSLRREIQQSTLSQPQCWLKSIPVLEALSRSGNTETALNARSHRPHRLQTSLTEAQEQIVVAVRKTLWLSLGDLLIVTLDFLYDKASRAGASSHLERYGVSRLKKMEKECQESTGVAPPKKTFKDYESG